MKKNITIEKLGFLLSIILRKRILKVLALIFRDKRPYFKFLYKLTHSYDLIKISNDVKRIMSPLKIKKDNPIYLDRIIEFCQFFNVGYKELNKIIAQFGVPDQPSFRENIFKDFNKIKETEIKTSYEKIAKLYTLRLLMRFERINDIYEFEQILESNKHKNVVLDYGCGTSDLGLIAASKGCDVTICDLYDEKFEFAKWRFQRNSLNVNTIPIKNLMKLPELEENSFDIILVADVMKQVINPKEYLKLFYNALRPGGLLFCNQGTPQNKNFSNAVENRFGPWSIGGQLNSSLSTNYLSDYETYFLKHFRRFDESIYGQFWWSSKKHFTS